MRIRSIAAVHERLCESGELASLDLGDYIRAIVPGIFSSFGGTTGAPGLEIHTELVPASLDDAVRCGLIVNELVANAIEHAFTDPEDGQVTIDLRRVDARHARLTVADNGVGLPEEIDPVRAETLGLQLAAGLAESLGGSLAVERSHGTAFSLVIPARAEP